MARKMVTEFGMSERVGAVKLGQSQGRVFLGRDMGHQRDYSEEVARVVDEEVRRFIESAHDEAWHVINDNRHILDNLVLELLEKETLNQAEVATIFKDIRKRPLREQWLSSEHRTVSDQPPVLTPAEAAALNGSGRHAVDGTIAVAPLRRPRPRSPRRACRPPSTRPPAQEPTCWRRPTRTSPR